MCSSTKSKVLVSVLSLVFAIWYAESTVAQEAKAQLSRTRYVDPKGFFKIVPPAGWRIREYPQDPRGKVAFMGPGDVALRVLTNPVDFTSFENY